MDPASPISEVTVRVNYSQTDQMGVVYHAHYVVWLDVARTEHLRRTGMSYKELEAMGTRLVVAELRVRYRQPARYDDTIRIRCWVRDLASRRIVFGYAIEHAETGALLATADTAMISLDSQHRLSSMPNQVMKLLEAIPDPVRV